jgi:hypothetical protein
MRISISDTDFSAVGIETAFLTDSTKSSRLKAVGEHQVGASDDLFVL